MVRIQGWNKVKICHRNPFDGPLLAPQLTPHGDLRTGTGQPQRGSNWSFYSESREWTGVGILQKRHLFDLFLEF